MTSRAEHAAEPRTLGAFEAFFDHGLLFVEDPESRSVHAGWDARTHEIHADHDSVLIPVRAYVDGIVRVELVHGFPAGVDELDRLYRGALALGRGALVLRDSDDLVRLEVLLPSETVDIVLYVDDREFASRVVVVVVP